MHGGVHHIGLPEKADRAWSRTCSRMRKTPV
jgi:hypothetical protein